jgi:hypothetical protein
MQVGKPPTVARPLSPLCPVVWARPAVDGPDEVAHYEQMNDPRPRRLMGIFSRSWFACSM